MDVYNELLNEYFTEQKLPLIKLDKKEPGKVTWECCTPESNHYTHELFEGYWTCIDCGKVKHRLLDEYEYSGVFSKHSGVNPGHNYVAFRFYKPINHFREHLRRFMGSRRCPIDISLFQDLNIQDEKSYYHVRDRLKLLKIKNQNKNIWSIIYALGGKFPILDSYTFQKIIAMFMKFNSNYSKYQGQRKSVVSHDMILTAIFKKVGYKSYYELPVIKNEKNKNNILLIIKECLG